MRQSTQFPKVTIGIPVFNEASFVADTIFSALNQTYDNLEILISDNSSIDGSFSIIQKTISGVKNAKAIRQDQNIGAVNNFNILVEYSSTQYFCWLSGHDILHKDYIASAITAFIKNPDFILVYPKSEFIDINGNLMNIESYSKIDTSKLDYINGPLKVANNLVYGTPIHGLFRTSFLKENKVKPIIGCDFSLLFKASITGKIYELPNTYHFLREVRQETAEETYKRYNEVGLKSKYSNQCTEMCKEYLRSALFSKKINLFQKTKLLIKLGIVLKERYNSPYLNNSILLYKSGRRLKQKIKRIIG